MRVTCNVTCEDWKPIKFGHYDRMALVVQQGSDLLRSNDTCTCSTHAVLRVPALQAIFCCTFCPTDFVQVLQSRAFCTTALATHLSAFAAP